MQLLGHVYSKESASRLRGLLASKGIPTFAKFSGSPWIGPYEAAVFVCLDEQYDDACALALDPNHVVAHPVDVSAYDQLAERQDVGPILKWCLIGLVVVALLFGAAAQFAGVKWSLVPNNSFKPKPLRGSA